MKTKRLLQKILLILPLMISINIMTSAQKIEINGQVICNESKTPLPGVSVIIKNTAIGVVTNTSGKYTIQARVGDYVQFSFIGYETKTVKVQKDSIVNVSLKPALDQLEEVVVTGYIPKKKYTITGACTQVSGSPIYRSRYPQPIHAEEYKNFNPNHFLLALDNPLSTFSIDVDQAAYSNVRRFINNGTLPPVDAVRTEEFLNYFTYDYPAPKGKHPVSITTEVSSAPWNSQHRLIHIGIKAKEIALENLPASNLVFLIDVSGSMYDQNKLPLLKSSMKLLVQQLRSQDQVAIVTYANNTKELLASTSGNEKTKIIEAIESLQASGGTAGGDGIQRAYKVAEKNFIKGGNNRIILATDGDFNIGISSPDELEKMIETKRATGIYLTVLGFGMGNYKDNRIQVLAEKGNGNHAYIDNLLEAKKVLVNEFGGTLFTVAKDVKIQVEFNPAHVQAYRLIGYESRMLEDKDFNDDTKDAGEMGSGHSVTALYEVIPVGVKSNIVGDIDPLKYQKVEKNEKRTLTNSPELLTVKLRYKQPNALTSTKMEVAVLDTKTPLNKSSENFRFSAAVAGFGMLLQNSAYKNDLNFDHVIQLAKQATHYDPEGYRKEFIRLVESAALLQ
ncbi:MULTISPECIES: vWA domain-containing protein [Odoribacteraceae]|uniref:vWA domain-containing protein n=1 Tax=Odoribacteraceae TaxID=1853231 RepID=UPI000E4D0948|nr:MULTISPECIES: von Willebrand factor type A domain-containing protein [Odoribacteraceae]MCQ4872911.1 von Willebrand factor type A domain-containing protein [Butyricimonas paravirosa]RHR78410.1 DUF3520 domain-containing protein [Odoribacter sp. AF15-53]